jgi:hypothetical protein
MNYIYFVEYIVAICRPNNLYLVSPFHPKDIYSPRENLLQPPLYSPIPLSISGPRTPGHPIQPFPVLSFLDRQRMLPRPTGRWPRFIDLGTSIPQN